jgi:hypothetical protein
MLQPPGPSLDLNRLGYPFLGESGALRQAPGRLGGFGLNQMQKQLVDGEKAGTQMANPHSLGHQLVRGRSQAGDQVGQLASA